MAPLTELTQAQAQLSPLIVSADPSGKAALDDAVAKLTAATAPSLWSDANDAIPPPEGDAVFTGSAAALEDLMSISDDHSVSRSVMNTASTEIEDAGAGLAEAALKRARLQSPARGGGTLQADQADYDHAFQVLGEEITQEVTSIPQQAVDQAAERFLESPSEHFDDYPQPISSPPLSVGGKPALFYYGAEACPYCAADRWSMALALSQFGSFSPLALTVSSTLDAEPSTNTLTFYGSRYQSSELAFEPVEAYTNQPATPAPCGYPWLPLQTPAPAEQAVLGQYDYMFGCPAAVIPFLDVANRWVTVGSYPDPTQINGMSWEQIAAAMSDASSPVAQYIDGGAEILAAQLCQATGQRPADVCNQPINRQYQQSLATGPTSIDPPAHQLFAVSCASTALCVAVDDDGDALLTHDPTAATPTWTAPVDIDGTQPIGDVSCPSIAVCVAVDYSGDALVSHDPTAATPTWTAPTDIDDSNAILSVSCASTLCVAVDDAGNAVVTRDSAAAAPTWIAPTDIDGANVIEDISCPSTSLCVAVDDSGNALVSRDPGAATPSWSGPENIDGTNPLASISCATTSLCVAVDYDGNALVSHDPDAATPTWSAPADIDGANSIYHVSCPSSSLCVAVDAAGNVLVSHDPGAATPTWSHPVNLDAVNALYGVSCPSTSMCLAVASNPYAYVSDNPTAINPSWTAHAKSDG